MATKRFNVCFLNARFFPIGGTAIRTLNFAKAIKNKVNNVTIITWQPIDSEDFLKNKKQLFVHDEIAFHTMPLGHKFLRKNFRGLYLVTLLSEFFVFAQSAIKKHKADVIHCGNDTIWIGLLLGKFTKTPIVADFHATPSLPGSELLPIKSKSFQRMLSHTVLNLLNKSITKYITPTQEVRSLLISWGVQPWKVKVIPNAISTEEKPINKSRIVLRRELNIDNETVVGVFHGVLVEQYNINALKNLRDISKIIKNNIQLKFKFLIIGYYEKAPPINDESFIYTGYVDHLQDYLKAADFAIVPIFHADGIRSRLLDYFRASLPILTTSVGITGMEFAKDCNGVIVRNDVRELANSAVDLAISPQKIKEMSKESGKQVSWFSPQKIGAELVNVYENGIQQG